MNVIYTFEVFPSLPPLAAVGAIDIVYGWRLCILSSSRSTSRV